MKLNKEIAEKKRQIDKWIETIKPKPKEEFPDFYGEIGCCLTCSEVLKQNIDGVQRHVYFNSKHYDCLCLEGKCSRCDWYDPYMNECSRKYVNGY